MQNVSTCGILDSHKYYSRKDQNREGYNIQSNGEWVISNVHAKKIKCNCSRLKGETNHIHKETVIVKSLQHFNKKECFRNESGGKPTLMVYIRRAPLLSNASLLLFLLLVLPILSIESASRLTSEHPIIARPNEEKETIAGRQKSSSSAVTSLRQFENRDLDSNEIMEQFQQEKHLAELLQLHNGSEITFENAVIHDGSGKRKPGDLRVDRNSLVQRWNKNNMASSPVTYPFTEATAIASDQKNNNKDIDCEVHLRKSEIVKTEERSRNTSSDIQSGRVIANRHSKDSDGIIVEKYTFDISEKDFRRILYLSIYNISRSIRLAARQYPAGTKSKNVYERNYIYLYDNFTCDITINNAPLIHDRKDLTFLVIKRLSNRKITAAQSHGLRRLNSDDIPNETKGSLSSVSPNFKDRQQQLRNVFRVRHNITFKNVHAEKFASLKSKSIFLMRFNKVLSGSSVHATDLAGEWKRNVAASQQEYIAQDVLFGLKSKTDCRVTPNNVFPIVIGTRHSKSVVSIINTLLNVSTSLLKVTNENNDHVQSITTADNNMNALPTKSTRYEIENMSKHGVSYNAGLHLPLNSRKTNYPDDIEFSITNQSTVNQESNIKDPRLNSANTENNLSRNSNFRILREKRNRYKSRQRKHQYVSKDGPTHLREKRSSSSSFKGQIRYGSSRNKGGKKIPPVATNCSLGYYGCNDGSCVLADRFCNGVTDCPKGGGDEPPHCSREYNKPITSR